MRKSILVIGIGFLMLSFSCNSALRIKKGVSTAIIDIPDQLYPSPDLLIPTHNEFTRKNYPRKIKAFKSDPLQLHDIVFLGNSITQQGGNWGKRLNNDAIKNRGIAGDVTDGVLQRLGEINFVKPAAVFIEIGINDLFNSKISPERTSAHILKIAQDIKSENPETIVVVQTIFPTGQPDMVERIRKTNDQIKLYAKKGQFRLMDTHQLFADHHDLMKKEFTTDGVHLNEAGYSLWVKKLERYFVE